MDFRRLRYFVAVADQLNFRRAAEALNTSQPSLSQQIRALEEELGIQLFERTKRRVRLTRAGSVYLAGVREAIAEVEACALRARDAQAGLRGALAIGANGMVMIEHLPPIVRRFRDGFPQVNLSITILRNPDIVRALRTGQIEIAFANAVEPDDDVETLALWSLPWCVVLPADHPLAGQAGVHLADLDGENLITHPRRGGAGGASSEIVALCREQGFTPRSVTEVAEIADLETLVGLVACGLGVTILPSPFGKAAPPAVVFKPIAGTDRGPRISACWRRHESNALVKNFLALASKGPSVRGN
jgi:DNA-binding transcriptional LysR family regulator